MTPISKSSDQGHRNSPQGFREGTKVGIIGGQLGTQSRDGWDRSYIVPGR